MLQDRTSHRTSSFHRTSCRTRTGQVGRGIPRACRRRQVADEVTGDVAGDVAGYVGTMPQRREAHVANPKSHPKLRLEQGIHFRQYQSKLDI